MYLEEAPLGTEELDRYPIILVEHKELSSRVVVHLGEVDKVAAVLGRRWLDL